MKQKFYEMVELAESAAEDFREHNDDRAIIWASKRIAELEVKVEAYRHANNSKAARIEKMREEYEEDAWSMKQYIAELGAQLPKVVTPRPSGDGSYDCDCDEDGVGGLYRTDAYCYKCGAKLNWEEA